MCRLFGIISSGEIYIDFSFFHAKNSFRSMSKDNPDGWGIAWYNEEPIIFKQSYPAHNFYDFHKVRQVKSNIILSHVRKAKTGTSKRENSHPFQYKNWIFEHNGNMNRNNIMSHLDSSYQWLLKGETDSEAFFFLIMQYFDEQGNIVKAIEKAVGVARKADHTGLNFLMSDGERIYAFRYTSNDKHDLFFIQRIPSGDGRICHKSQETGETIECKNSRVEVGVMFSSEKLTNDEEWASMRNGQLIIADKTGIVRREII